MFNFQSGQRVLGLLPKKFKSGLKVIYNILVCIVVAAALSVTGKFSAEVSCLFSHLSRPHLQTVTRTRISLPFNKKLTPDFSASHWADQPLGLNEFNQSLY